MASRRRGGHAAAPLPVWPNSAVIAGAINNLQTSLQSLEHRVNPSVVFPIWDGSSDVRDFIQLWNRVAKIRHTPDTEKLDHFQVCLPSSWCLRLGGDHDCS